MPSLVKRKIEGIWMWLDPEDHGVGQRLCAKGKREECFMWLLRRHAHGIGFDVGANIGYCTLSLAEKCGSVCAYEPSPYNMLTLRKNINLNELENVFPMRYAIGDACAERTFYITKKPNLNSLIPTEGLSIQVKVRTIDSLPDVPNFIKMDIEGGEVGALQGAEKNLSEAEDLTILIEVHPEKYSPTNDFATVLRHVVFELGYRIKYVINAKGKRHVVEQKATLYKDGLEKERAIWTDVDPDTAIKWATEMPEDGLKVVRAIMLVKG